MNTNENIMNTDENIMNTDKKIKRLIVLGNKNKYTFCNSIVAANEKANGNIKDIFVIHTKESFETLIKKEKNNEETSWRKHLYEECKINDGHFIHRELLSNEEESIENFVKYIKEIIKKCPIDSFIIDLSNGSSENKTLLSIISYILDVEHKYCIDTNSLFNEFSGNEDKNRYFKPEEIDKHYKKMSNNREVDQLAYLNLTSITRYKEKINELSKKYNDIIKEPKHKDGFFENNLLNAILLKIENDNKKSSENSIYRISSTAISASLEDLIDQFLVKIDIDESFREKTLGGKITLLEDHLNKNKTEEFDIKFLKEFNRFMKYLRNSTTHKGKYITDSEKYKAELSMYNSIIFLEYYSSVVSKILTSNTNKEDTLKVDDINLEDIPNIAIYFGLDGDNTGQNIESYLESNQSEEEIKKLSSKINKAKKDIVKYINSTKRGEIIFAEGDDILFKGKFNRDDLMKMQKIYSNTTVDLTCSIAYGETFKELLFSMKLAKMEKNSIRGVKIYRDNV